jgi:hypothetical protein
MQHERVMNSCENKQSAPLCTKEEEEAGERERRNEIDYHQILTNFLHKNVH